jgi:hypothetical protein
MQSSPLSVDKKASSYARRGRIMTNVSKVILGAAIAAATIATPALASLEQNTTNPLLSGNTVNPVLSGNTVVQGHEARRGDLWEGGGP